MTGRTSLQFGCVTLLSALLLGATPGLVQAQSPSEPAPPFSVKTFEGRVLRLSELKGRPVVLDFWATWCRPCRAAMPHLDEVQKRFSDRGLVVSGLCVDGDGTSDVQRFAHDRRVYFPHGMANEKVLDNYGPIRSLPTTYFISRDGAVVRRVKGYIDPETLDSYVLELVQAGHASGGR